MEMRVLTPSLLAAALAFSAGYGWAQTPPGPPAGGPRGTPDASAPGPSRADVILQDAVEASHMDPAKWDWPPSASPEVRQQIIDGHYTTEELRNIYTALAARYRGPLWPTHGIKPANPSQTGLEQPNFIMHGRGFGGLEQFYGSNGYGGVSDRIDKIDTLIAHGDRVYVSWMITGTHTGKTFGFPGDGKPYNVRESSLTTYKDGKMAEATYIGDDFALYTQAGGKISFPDKP
jgi:hypothetical protein